MPLPLLLLYLFLDFMSRTPLTRGIAEWHMSLVKAPQLLGPLPPPHSPQSLATSFWLPPFASFGGPAEAANMQAESALPLSQGRSV